MALIDSILVDASPVSKNNLRQYLSEREAAGYWWPTVLDMVEDTGFSYSSGARKIIAGQSVSAGAYLYEVAASGATDHHVTTAGGVKLYVLPLGDTIYLDAFGITPDDESAADANKTNLAAILTYTQTAGACKVLATATQGVYWFPTETTLGAAGVRLNGGGAVFKQKAGSQTTNWFLVTACDGFQVRDIEFDGNRANVPSMDTDSSLVVVYNVADVLFENCKVHGSPGKGLSITSGVAGSGTRDIQIVGCEGWNCEAQVFTTDRTNLVDDDTIPCEDIIFDRVVVTDTDHAGITVQDGSRRVTVSNCILDVNNGTWDALGIRGARQVRVSNTIGRRGRNGVQILLLSAAALARGEDCRDIVLTNNLWEHNQQSGCAIIGAAGVSVTGDTARNNGQVLGTYFGFIAIQQPGVRRASDISFIGVHGLDDQSVATQHTGLAVLAADNVKVISPDLRGNTTRNKAHYDSSVTGLEVIGDGVDGATVKKVSGTTGSIASAGAATVTVNFTTAFAVAPTRALASVQVASSAAALVVDHVEALTTAAIQVRVRNTGATSFTGTVHATAEYVS